MPTSWLLTAHRVVDRGARVGAGDGEALAQADGEIGSAQRNQLLVRIDLVAVAPGEALGGQDAPGEADQQDAGSLAEQAAVGRGIEPGPGWRRQSGRHRAGHLHSGRLEVECRHRGDAGHDDRQRGRDVGSGAAQGEQARQQGQPEQCGRQVGLAQSLNELEQLWQHLVRLARIAQQLGQLADDDDDGDPVEVAGQDRLREEAREEAEAAEPGHDVERARDQRQHRQEREVPRGVALRQRGEARRDHDAGGGVGAEDQLARGAEQRIGHQREDRGVDADRSRHAGELRVGDPDRQADRRDRQARRHVLGQPRRDRSGAARPAPAPSAPVRCARSRREWLPGSRRRPEVPAQYRLGTMWAARKPPSTALGCGCAFGIFGRSTSTLR